MVFPLCLPCVVLVWWVGDCVLVVSCVAWAGLLELRFCIWFGTCCCVITRVGLLLAKAVLVRVSCSCVGLCLSFVCALCFVVCWLVGWVWIRFGGLVGQGLRFKQMCWIFPCKCCVCLCVWCSCAFLLFFLVCLACVVSCASWVG